MAVHSGWFQRAGGGRPAAARPRRRTRQGGAQALIFAPMSETEENVAALRGRAAAAKRVVIKIGTRVLVRRSGRPDARRIRQLVDQIARLHAAGREVIVVTSGAIAAGMATLGLRSRPTNMPELQMCAAVGQTRLMGLYDAAFARRGVRIGQVLLTHEDLKHRTRHLNARNTMMTLLRHGIVPVVNENDVIATEEIRFGDNDALGALVALLVQADALLLLTTVDGFRLPGGNGRTKRAAYLAGVDESTLAHAVGKGSHLSTGGMASKLQSAGLVVDNGIPVVIANGQKAGTISRVAAGEDVGTLICRPDGAGVALNQRERWIAHFHKPEGALVVDDGARAAILERGRSLLPIGVREVEGHFEPGALVSVRGPDGQVFARGLTDYASDAIKLIRGRRSEEIAQLLGSRDYSEVIHRDNMIIVHRAG